MKLSKKRMRPGIRTGTWKKELNLRFMWMLDSGRPLL